MKNNSKLLVALFLFTIAIMVLPMLSSCGKQSGSVVPSEAKIQYQIANLSYDILPVRLYVNLLPQNSNATYTYPNVSGYFGLTNIDTPFQIRSAATTVVTNLLKIDSNKLSRNTKYTLYLTGSRAGSNLTYIFTVDTSSVPTVGRGKVRFVNAAPDLDITSTGLDITANDTVLFTKKKYKAVTDYVELSAGLYNFNIRPSKSAATSLKQMTRQSIQDGRLYTIYTYGLAGATDTTAFGAGIITNR